MSDTVEPIYHLKDAAERCGVATDVLRSWIRQGLRAMPLVKTKRAKSGPLPRDFVIRESWIMAFLESRSRVKVTPRPGDETEKPAGKPRRRGRVAADDSSPLGPCPV